jgi:uncharacterized RDD family membrane protein YckC
VSRWTQSWLTGPTEQLPEIPTTDTDGPDYPGQRLGLPERGPGSAAGFGPRILAIIIDWLPCSVAAQLFTKNPAFSALTLFAIVTVVSIAIAGRRRAGFGAAVIRTVLLCLLIPPVVYNLDGRGLHDRAAGTIVLRTR